MEFLPEKLVKEWSWRVDNGMPDYRNPLHLVELKNLLIERRFPHDFINLFLNELEFKDKAAFDVYNKKHKMRKSTKVNIGDTETTVGDAEKGDEKTTDGDISQDHKITDSQLMMTKTKAKEQAAQKGSKDVGAGTPESRAGEAMVHKGLRMLQEGKSIEEIKQYFDELVNSDDHILNSKEGKKWVKASISTMNRIDKEIGIKNIKNV